MEFFKGFLIALPLSILLWLGIFKLAQIEFTEKKLGYQFNKTIFARFE